MNKLLVICGPTAVGKTKLGARLAKKFKGELISADSRQVYREMDIGTGKDHPRTTKIHLINLVRPNQEFSLSLYYRLAWEEIKILWKKKKLPILVGGTGFYIKGVVDGVATKEIPRNLKLRTKLNDWPAERLFNYLAQIDFERAGLMNQSDRKNPRRLIRAIEVAIFQKENPSWKPAKHLGSDHLLVGLTAPLKAIDKRIKERVQQRLAQGLESEIKMLFDQGYTWTNSALGDTLGYQEWKPFFKGRASRRAVIERWITDERQYARKQITWFKKDKRVNWFDISKKGWENEVEDLVKEWYHKNDA